MSRGWLRVLILGMMIVLLVSCSTRLTEYEEAQQTNEKLQNDIDNTDLAKEKRSRAQSRTSANLLNKSIPKPKPKVKVAGIYVSGYVAGNAKSMNRIINLLEQTELNTVVIDIKNDAGHITYDSQVPLANEIGSDRQSYIPEFSKLLQTLHDKDIYVIGRLVAFKDPFLAGSKPDYAMKRKDNGQRWKDRSGVSWVDPYHEQVRQYNLDIAREAAKLGVDEIQFDYVRFPDNGGAVDREVLFPHAEGRSKSELISLFLAEAREQIHPLGALLSADVFGLTTSVKDDMGIGQKWEAIAREVDAISPMVYPSHYSEGMYGVHHPDTDPYAIVKRAMQDAKNKNKMVTTPPIIRPWFQSFTAAWVHPHLNYGRKEIEAQIQAAREQGVEQYLLWDPRCRYDAYP